MNKVELVKGIAEETGITQKDANEFVDAFVKVAKEGLVEDGKVQLVGFLTLEVKDTAERKGYNIHTEEAMIIPAGKTVRARVSKKVRELIQE